MLLRQRARRVVGLAPSFEPFVVASLQTAQQLRLIERADAPVKAGSHPIQAKTALDGGPGSPRSRASPFLGDWANLTNLHLKGASYGGHTAHPPMWTILREGLINPASPM